MGDVAFAPNRRVVTKARYDEMNRTLVAYNKKSGVFDICGGKGSKATRNARATNHTLSAVLATFNAQATDTAPPEIRAITARDQHELAGQVANALLDDFMKDSPTDTGVTRGLKSVGRGFKRLFGGK